MNGLCLKCIHYIYAFQQTAPGTYIANLTDKLITPGKYLEADVYLENRLKKVLVAVHILDHNANVILVNNILLIIYYYLDNHTTVIY